MNRDQKAAAIAEIADQIQQAEAVFAVDYRGISVPQAAELRTLLRGADARFRIVKNSLTERAADQAGAEVLKPLLEGPTALTFVRGDVAMAAKAISDYSRRGDVLAFKGGFLGGQPLTADQIRDLARLPSRDVLYGQLVGLVATPISGLARTLNALVQGLAIQLGQIRDKKESGELPAGEPPAPAEAQAQAPAEPEAEAPAEPEAEAPAAEAPPAEPPASPAGEASDQDAEAPEPASSTDQPAEGADDAPAQPDESQTDNDQADASAQSGDAEAQ